MGVSALPVGQCGLTAIYAYFPYRLAAVMKMMLGPQKKSYYYLTISLLVTSFQGLFCHKLLVLAVAPDG